MSHIRNIAKKLFESEKNNDKKAFVGRVLNMIEFIQYFPGSATADQLLFVREHSEKHGLVPLLDFEGANKEFAKGVDEFVTAHNMEDTFCMRCGKALSNEKSVQKGMGLVCRAKAKKNEWVDVRKPRKDLAEGEVTTVQRRVNIAENDKLTPETGRKGLRKLGLEYKVTISTIRHDRDVNEMEALVATKLIEELGEAGTEPLAVLPPEPVKKTREEKDKEKADKKKAKDQEKADKQAAKDKADKEKKDAKQADKDKADKAKKEKPAKKPNKAKATETPNKEQEEEKKAADAAAFE